MKQIKFNILLGMTLVISQICSSQKLSLNDIENICNKANWESVNQFMMNNNWEYYESTKGDSDKYSTITWSYNKSYGDKAEAWFYLYTYEGSPHKISYSVFNKPSYSLIQNSLASKNYKLENSIIEDNELISTYTNSNFLIKISTEKTKEEEGVISFNDESITSYTFQLIKNSSIYDPNNGFKTEYHYGNTKRAEYTLRNGELNGLLKAYHENGQTKKLGNYLNGKGQGKFFEYDENGNKIFEYSMLNDKRQGFFKAYENEKISYTANFKDDLQNGEKIEYYYDDESGVLNFKAVGEYLNNEKNGAERLIYIEDGKERLLTITNYTNGIKNGSFQKMEGDSLIIGNYRNDKLDGKYQVYIDFIKNIIGGVINTDITKLVLISSGEYSNDSKTGYWKNYDLTGSLTSEGNYSENEKFGEWKFYYPKYVTEDNQELPYSTKLYLTANYTKGELNGISKRLSYLDHQEYPCSELDKNNQKIDSCMRTVYTKVFQTSEYRNDKLNGQYEVRDSLNTIIAKGHFKNGLQNGEWLHRYNEIDFEGNPYHYFMKGSYLNDKKEGEWILFYEEGKINKTLNYLDGELHGQVTEWNDNKKPKEIRQFIKGKFMEVVAYDSIGNSPDRKYEIFDENNSGYKCRLTNYNINGKFSQVFWLKKDDQIDSNFFELSFFLKLRKNDESVIHADGEYIKYDSSDKPLIVGNYFKESKIGKWTYFDYSQNVKFEVDYEKNEGILEEYYSLDNNPYSGDFTYQVDNENVKEVRSIKDGLRDGKTEFIDTTTGKTINKIKYKEGLIK